MPWTSEHLNWLIDTGDRLSTADGNSVQVWEPKREKCHFIYALAICGKKNLSLYPSFYTEVLEKMSHNETVQWTANLRR